MNDLDNARYVAISGLGFGWGHTPGEAIENYVSAQLRNHPAKNTVFGTKAKWEAALRTGEVKATVWHGPEGVTGFFSDHEGLHWRIGEETRKATLDELLDDRQKRDRT